MTKKIICVGNRFIEGDDTGPRVYDCLEGMSLPPDVEIIDGGLMGLNLLATMEGASSIVFVDSLSDFPPEDGAVVIDQPELNTQNFAKYGHSGGLNYLIGVLPNVWEGRLPDIKVAGAAGVPDDETIRDIALKCLEMVGENESQLPQ